ncbi:Protein CBG25278 [Caenorhabditis briggsae]|uniref:Protein CBG25278 n=1 Tax=Caenorhabditis briggsae TaxID=6238 RepID=B6IIJ6_CAEBR|nr:Protein CBG25278 [Caenorhabditis briggsae]CAR99726.1 Protein CBG25278 [Caenorhabditis briggsae]
MNFGFLIVLMMAVVGALGGWSHSFSHSHEFHGHHHGGLLGGGGFNPYGGYYQSSYWGRKK